MRVSECVVGVWWSLTVAYIEVFNGTKITVVGDNVPYGENAILLSNHLTAVDWMFCWTFAVRKGCLGRIKNVLKSSLMMLPVFGWAFKLAGFLHLDRDWERDAAKISDHLAWITKNNMDIWLLLFPEGTRFDAEKKAKSIAFSTKNNLPLLQNVLGPRTRGWVACFQGLRGHIDAVYDLTLAYDPAAPRGSTFVALLGGIWPKEATIHVIRHPVKSLPKDDDALSQWCWDAYEFKDKSITNHQKTWRFLHPKASGDYSSGSTTAADAEEKPAPRAKLLAATACYVFYSVFCVNLLWNYALARQLAVVSVLVCIYYACADPIKGMIAAKRKKKAGITKPAAVPKTKTKSS